MRMVVDRIEGGIAVLDVEGTLVELPAAALPPGATEGSNLGLVLVPDDSLREEGLLRLQRLKKRSPSGSDIEL